MKLCWEGKSKGKEKNNYSQNKLPYKNSNIFINFLMIKNVVENYFNIKKYIDGQS